jgi:MFS family permease
MDGRPTIPRLVPFAVVFAASTCVMTLELVASRLIAPFVGANLFTWTSIIAVVLAGLSIGNLSGGLIASRTGPSRVDAWIAAALLASAVLALVAVAVVGPVFTASTQSGWILPVRILVGVTIVFFLPAIVLGTISPLAATWAISARSDLGTTVGSLYAVGSIGAIVGTLLTGFVLINAIGSVAIVVGVAWSLALAALMAKRGLLFVSAALFVVVAGTVVAWGASGRPPVPVASAAGQVVYARETAYQTVAVAWDPERGVRTVVLDNLVHGFVVPDDLRQLLYPYIAMYAAAYEELRSERGSGIVSLHLGGGAFTMPRYLADAFPDDHVVVAEIDPGVTEANHVAARLERPPPFELHHQDAREVVRMLMADGRRVDVVFADAFSDYAIPFHLTTLEFYREVDGILAAGGWMLQNVIDDLDDPRMLAAIVATVRQIHDHVIVLSPAALSRLRGRDTFVVMSSRAPIDAEAIVGTAQAAGVEATVVPLDVVLTGVPSASLRPLRDDFAPVERLIAHLYRTAAP